MHDWCKRRDRKRKNRQKGQTAGKTKGANCQATALERYMAKTSRSYKHPLYSHWLEASRFTAAGGKK